MIGVSGGSEPDIDFEYDIGSDYSGEISPSESPSVGHSDDESFELWILPKQPSTSKPNTESPEPCLEESPFVRESPELTEFPESESPESSHPCEHCAKTFQCQKSLKIHQSQKHVEIAKKLCDLCGKGFASPSQLHEHFLYRHSKERRHQCHKCYKVFKTRSNLNQHLRTHFNTQSYRCEKCKKSFTESGYRYHMLTHQDKKFTCSDCGKCFLQNKLLRKHVQSIHSSERRFHCDHCPATFKRKDHLNRHTQDRHTILQIKLFECPSPNCQARFKSGAQLQQHQKLHADTDFVCEECGKRFRRKQNLRIHFIKTHEEQSKRLECLHCNFVFLYPSELRYHLKANPDHCLLNLEKDAFVEEVMESSVA